MNTKSGIVFQNVFVARETLRRQSGSEPHALREACGALYRFFFLQILISRIGCAKFAHS